MPSRIFFRQRFRLFVARVFHWMQGGRRLARKQHNIKKSKAGGKSAHLAERLPGKYTPTMMMM